MKLKFASILFLMLDISYLTSTLLDHGHVMVNKESFLRSDGYVEALLLMRPGHIEYYQKERVFLGCRN